MKTTWKKGSIGAFLTLLMANFMVLVADAQEASPTTTTTTTHTTKTIWYAEPWVWVVGGIILVLLLVQLGLTTPTAMVQLIV